MEGAAGFGELDTARMDSRRAAVGYGRSDLMVGEP